MFRRLRGRMTYASTVATLALFVALGGSSYAAFTLPKNSVGTKQLKNNAVISSKLKNNAVTTSKIKNGAVTAKKLNVTGVTVPNAVQANHALTAGTTNFAANATNATNATNAQSAATLGGQAPSTFELASRTKRFTIAMNAGDQDVSVVTLGTLSIAAHCIGTNSAPHAQLLFANSQGHATYTDSNIFSTLVGTAPTAFVTYDTPSGGGTGSKAGFGFFSAPDGSSLEVSAQVIATGGGTTGISAPCFFAGLVDVIAP